MGFVVAIDGPAGSGKGTVTKIVAERKNLISIDTGAMYRCVALDCINNGIEAITEIASDIKCYDKNKVEILSITDTNISNGMYERDLSPMLKRCSMNSDYEEEQYFIPEFIKELFNNNIILKKELVLKVQL